MNTDGTDEIDVSLRPQAPFVDTFTGELIDPFRHLHYRVGAGLAYTQANGRLEITVPADTSLDPDTGFAATGLMSNCQVTGNRDLQVDYELLTWPPDNGVLQNLQAATSSTASECRRTGCSSSPAAGSPASRRTSPSRTTPSSRTPP